MVEAIPMRRKRTQNDDAPENEEAVPGHNSGAEEVTETSQTIAAGQLRAFLERIERLQEEKQTIADDIKELYAEIKGVGFDTPTVRAIVRLRKMDQAERAAKEAILDLYKSALGMA